MRERAFISDLTMMAYVRGRGTDCVLSRDQTGAVRADGRRTRVSPVKVVGEVDENPE